MPPGRNDPCPCGSGRKYKQCCAAADARRDQASLLLAGSPGALASRVSMPPGEWEVDAIAIPGSIADQPDARLAVAVVGAGGVILHAAPEAHPPSEHAEIAAWLAQVLAEAAAVHQSWPRELLVRHASVAAALAPLVTQRGITVRTAHTLPTLDAAAPSLRGHMGGASERDAPLSVTETWAGWRLPPELVRDVFAAAAEFHRARPWTHLYNVEVLEITVPPAEPDAALSRWTACVLGNGGEEFGVTMYADVADFLHTVEAAHPAEAFHGMRDRSFTLDFERRAELPRPMQREIASAHWEVADADAYPRLWCLNTPAGGMTRADTGALVRTLSAVARFATAHEALLAAHPVLDEPLTWTDGASGVIVSYVGNVLDSGEPLWDTPVALAAGGAFGPSADPEARVDPDAEDDGATAALLGDFAASLAATGLKAPTVTRHLRVAELFMDFLRGYQGAELAALHEFDLRAFLYDWLPRKVLLSRADAMAVPGSLRRFFRFVEERQGLACPWAGAILADRDTFAERWDTFPGGFWWDASVQEWQREFANDLEARAMLPSDTLAGGEQWGETMGFEEARLQGMLQRSWLKWRDEAIAAGTVVPADVRRALAARQHEWETTPRPELGGRSPAAVIRHERAVR